MYHNYRKELRTTLVSVRAIAITVDVWTKRKMSYICLTGHAFNSKYESIPLVLGLRTISGPHEAPAIKKYIIYELCRLNIQDKVCAIVTDNGSDVKKAVNDIKPDLRLSCLAHDLNLVVKNGLRLWDTPTNKKWAFLFKMKTLFQIKYLQRTK